MNLFVCNGGSVILVSSALRFKKKGEKLTLLMFSGGDMEVPIG